MELRELDPALAEAMRTQQVNLEGLSQLSGAKGAFGRIGLRIGENFQNALTGETLRRTQPEDIMEAVGRMAGFQLTSTALQFLHMVPEAQREEAMFTMVQAMLIAASDYSSGMINAYMADTAPGMNFSMRESGPVTVTPKGGYGDAG